MTDPAEAIERRIDGLRAAVRGAVTAGEPDLARQLRAELRRVEAEWDDAIAALARTARPARAVVPRQPGPLLPLRDQVHQALIRLGAPAAPRLVIAVHRALHPGTITPARLTSLRRDEERSFRAAPFARPFYLCPALTADLLAPVRGLLAVSTWPMALRVIGPLSPRVDFLTAAARLAEHLGRSSGPSPAAWRLLWQFAANIPDAAPSPDRMDPAVVGAAARAELAVHADADRSHREAAARRARDRLDDAAQLFGTRLRTVASTTA